MNALAPHIATKVARLVAMLSTDHDSEALAAVRALGRTLDSAGYDFNDLAAVIEASQPAIRRPQEASGPYINDAIKALQCCDRLSAWEISFLNDLAQRLWDGRGVSQHQAAKVQEIYAQRIGGAL
jgi:hypothetical protein